MTTTQDIKNFRKDLIKQGIISKPLKVEKPQEILLNMEGLEYDKIPAIRNSELSYLDKSPAHWLAWAEGKLKESDVFVTGRMLHRAILERDLFNNEFVIKADARTKEGKATNERNLQEGKFLVTDEQLSMVNQIADNFSKDKLIKKMFEGAIIEQPLGFRYKGFNCKAKPDILKPKKYAIDLKFVVDAKPSAFIRKAELYDYDRQAAFYNLALQANKLHAPKMKYYLLAVEKTPPYAYSLIEISQGVLRQGLEKVNLLMDKYSNTVAKGIYEGYPNAIWNEL